MADEVSEQPAVQQPEQEVSQETIEEPTQESAPAEPAQPEEVSPAPEEEDQEAESELPRELVELDNVLAEIHLLTNAVEHVLNVTTDLAQQKKIQKQLHHYAKSLGHLPKALQMLNDLRRFTKPVADHAEQVRKMLTDLRKDDALTSEETRVITSSASMKETLVDSINSLEFILDHVRKTSHELLTVIQYEKPNFKHFAIHMFADHLLIHKVSATLHVEQSRLSTLREDIWELHELHAHAEELSNV